MLMVSSLSQLHLLTQDDHSELKHDFFGHMMQLAPVFASCDANGFKNGSTEFIEISHFFLHSLS